MGETVTGYEERSGIEASAIDSVESKLRYRRLGTGLCGAVQVGVRYAQSRHDLA